MRREQWPKGRGIDYLDANGEARVEVYTSLPEGVRVRRLEQAWSLCGRGTHYMSLDRKTELGVVLSPEKLSGKALVELVTAHGKECE